MCDNSIYPQITSSTVSGNYGWSMTGTMAFFLKVVLYSVLTILRKVGHNQSFLPYITAILIQMNYGTPQLTYT